MSYEKRSDIPVEYIWDKEAIFATPQLWNEAVDAIAKQIPDLEKYKGKLNNKETILKFFQMNEEMGPEIEKAYVYAFLNNDENSKDTDAQMRMGKMLSILGKLSEATAFVTPELTKLDDKFLQEMIDDKDFENYNVELKDILKGKKHVLNSEEEKILASVSQVTSGFKEAFDRLNNGDLKFGTMKVDGKKIDITHGSYSTLLQNPNQKVRAEAFKKYYKGFIGYINTLASLYSSNVKADWFRAKTRKFKSCMEAALFYEDVDKKVYTNLIDSVHSALPPLHDYIALRKEVMGLDTLNMYDLYTPMIKGADIKLDFEDAFKLVVEGLKPLGKDYQDLLKRAKKERWMDVYETPGKRSGAYSIGVGDVHPFVLLNYQPTIHDVSTIAHELGHSMHSYYSSKAQCYDKSNYTIFVAEVASTTNEILLLKHMLKKAENDDVKKYLLTTYLDMLRTTMFRQAMFAEFEYITHSYVEKDKTLTYENMCKEYLKLNKKYYGKAVKHNKEISYEWCRIPHFYRSFYVYKYATGIISAVCIAEKILSEGKPAVENYKKFLSLGCSMDPVSELKVAGVDLTSKEPFEIVNKSFADTLNELKKLLNK